MKVKLLTTISFFTYQLSISQTEKLLHGKVVSQNLVINDVEVINKTAQTTTRTNTLGEFTISVKAQDSLFFFAKDYLFTKLKITSKEIETNNIVVNMILKPEELDEVLIAKNKLSKISYDAEAIGDIIIEKQLKDLSGYTFVQNGSVKNELNIKKVGSTILDLLQKEKPKKEIPKIDFRQLINTTCSADFFAKDLKLNSEEKELFLQFCDADPKSKLLLEHPNILATMDFLYIKNDEFKKLKTKSN
jgi:hypothetical protein